MEVDASRLEEFLRVYKGLMIKIVSSIRDGFCSMKNSARDLRTSRDHLAIGRVNHRDIPIFPPACMPTDEKEPGIHCIDLNIARMAVARSEAHPASPEYATGLDGGPHLDVGRQT